MKLEAGKMVLQFQLVEQTRRALRARAVDLALQLLDLQLEVRDQRLVVGTLGKRNRCYGFRLIGPRARGDQRGLQRVNVIGECVQRRCHAND